MERVLCLQHGLDAMKLWGKNEGEAMLVRLISASLLVLFADSEILVAPEDLGAICLFWKHYLRLGNLKKITAIDSLCSGIYIFIEHHL